MAILIETSMPAHSRTNNGINESVCDIFKLTLKTDLKLIYPTYSKVLRKLSRAP